MSVPSFAASSTAAAIMGSTALTALMATEASSPRGISGLMPAAELLAQPPSQASYQAIILSQASSQSAYHWGRVDLLKQQQQQQQQGQFRELKAYGHGEPGLGRPSHGHGSLQGVSPSESSGSLAQYGIGSTGSSLLTAGPGSLCAALPYYVRHPPIEAVVFGWGVSEDGQLGLAESGANVVVPKVVEALLGVQLSGRSFTRTPLVAGSRNTMVLDAAGQVMSFGWNDRGTLGHGHQDKERKPKRVTALKGIRIVQMAIGGWHCLALSDRGTMFAWGGNEYGQCGSVRPGQRDITEPMPVDLGIGPHQRVKQVAAGGMHSLALLEDGTVWQWGENWGDFSMHPVRTPRPVPGAVAVAAVSCGAFHNLALTMSGRVLSWGMNDYGQLGNGSTTYATAPRPVLDMEGVVVADIAAGGWHSCALSSAGEVWVWGRGEYGRLGLGDRSGSSKLRPQKVRGLESHVVVQVAAGGSHTLALTSTARLFVWGRGAFGRLGMGNPERDCYHPVECPLPGGTERWRVAAIGAGGRHSICLAIPVRDMPSTGGLGPGEGEEDVSALMSAHRHSAAAASAMASVGNRMSIGIAPGPGAAAAAFGSILPQQLQSLNLQPNGGEEYDNLDGCSEPSLYGRDILYEQAALPGATAPVRPTGATADGSVTADGSITAASSVAAITAAGGSHVENSGVRGVVRNSKSGGNHAAVQQPQPQPQPPLPSLQPPAQSPLTDWPSIDSSGVMLSVDSTSLTAPPHTSSDPPSPVPSLLSASATAPPLSQLTLRPSSVAMPPPPPPAMLLKAPTISGDHLQTFGNVDSSRELYARPKSPLRFSPPGSMSMMPSASFGMRRSSSAVGSLSQLSQLLPEPAAVAAAAVLDADSDLAPPRGLAAAAAAVTAAAAGGPGSVHNGSIGGGGSRNGSVTGMLRFRTVFGGGGEEEDEATQAAEAAEAAAEVWNNGSGTGDEDQLNEELDAQDDTDEDQVYDGSVVQHPRSPSLMSRPRSPQVPLSPRRHGSISTHTGVGGSRSASPALLGGSGSISGGGAVAGSPSSRALLSPYGSPRMLS